MVAMYDVYHGPEGLKKIAERTASFTRVFVSSITTLGYRVTSPLQFFDSVNVYFESKDEADAAIHALFANEINACRLNDTKLTFEFHKTYGKAPVSRLINLFGGIKGATVDVDRVME